MRGAFGLHKLILFALTVLLTASVSAFAARSAAPGASDADALDVKMQSEAVLDCRNLLTGNDKPINAFAALGETYSLNELPTLVQKYPSLVMDAAQLFLAALKRYEPRMVREPAYRTDDVLEYPIFADGVSEARGLRIIGQHEPIMNFADWLESRASGARSSKMFALVGPAGTGKTLLLNILDNVNAHLASNEPTYFQWTFEFRNLSKIPGLAPIISKTNPDGPPLVSNLSANNSPVVLLPPTLQQKVIELGRPGVEKLIGYPPSPFLVPSPQTDEIVKHIIAYEMQQRGITGQAPTESQYFEMLEPYVRIVRRVYNTNQPSVIVRAQGKSPELSQLLISENLALSTRFGPANPLSYHYTGQVLRSQNGGLLLDEFERQDTGLKNMFLEIAQNGVVEYSGAPAMKLNVVPVLADNDESIDAAKEEGSALARLDRAKMEPMRSLLEPAYIGKLAIEMTNPAMFTYRGYSEPEDTRHPMDLNVVFPQADANGRLVSPDDGHYAIYYQPSAAQSTLIAPRAQLLFDLTVAATRLEFDANKIQPVMHEFPSIAANSQYFTNPVVRMKVLLGELVPPARVAADLAKARKVLREGQNGISARDAEGWWKAILDEAEHDKTSVTPMIVDRVFIDSLDKGQIKLADNSPKGKARYLQLHTLMKAEIILPMLANDISNIISGDSGRVDRMYDEIRGELLELDSDPQAQFFYPDREKTPINRNRLEEIMKLYAEMHTKPLSAGLLKNFHVDVQAPDARFPPLVETISRYLMQKEFDTNTMTEIYGYFKGKSVSENGRKLGMHAESNLARYGYDRDSFTQALLFVRDQQAELANLRKRGGPTPQ